MRMGSSPSGCTPCACPSNPARGKAQGRIVSEASKKEASEADRRRESKPRSRSFTPSRICRSIVCSHSLSASGEISPTKINRADDMDANGTWARPISNDRPPAQREQTCEGYEPHERRRASKREGLLARPGREGSSRWVAEHRAKERDGA
jgi:hypothetical protein